jgi:hypothetical protein
MRSAIQIWMVLLLLGAAPARADQQTTDRARQHFRKGEYLYRVAAFEEAIAEYAKRVPFTGLRCVRTLGP